MDRFITVYLGKEEFALPHLLVKELIGVSKITPLPGTPNYFLGLMNLRGQVISVIDLRLKLGIKAPDPSAENTIIFCDLPIGQLGIRVDSVNAVMSPSPESISEVPVLQSGLCNYVSAVFQHRDKLILLLDLEKVFSGEDKKTIAGARKQVA